MTLSIKPNFSQASLDIAMVEGQPITPEEAIVVLLDELIQEVRAMRSDDEGRHQTLMQKLDWIGVSIPSE